MAKILIVEDNEMNMRLFADLVKTKGHEVFECLEGKKALQMAKDIKPDLILMDIQMPEVDGLTVTKLIRQEKEIAKTKIIAVTAFAMPGDLDRILEGGLDDYISKPISVPKFLDMIEKALTEK
jgi:two-component system cell cycle response regulator DivK